VLITRPITTSLKHHWWKKQERPKIIPFDRGKYYSGPFQVISWIKDNAYKQEGEDDAAQHNEDPLRVPIRPITRPKSKQLKQLFIGYVQRWWKSKSSPISKDEEELKAFYNSLSADFRN